MKIYTAIASLTTALLCSCSGYYYTPNKANIPNLREKNDLRIDAGIGTGWVMMGAELQTAYALTSHLGVMVNGSFGQSKGKAGAFDYNFDYTKHRYLEAGLGYFAPMPEDDRWGFEIFGGGGKGDYNIHYLQSGRAVLDMNKFFFQPSMTYAHPRRNIELSIGSRFTGLNYNNRFSQDLQESDIRRVHRFTGRRLNLYWEPSFRFSAGSRKVKGYLSFTPSVIMLGAKNNREFYNFNMGIRFMLNTASRQLAYQRLP